MTVAATLYFQRSNGERVIIKEFDISPDEEEVLNIIHEFLDKHNYKSYYTTINTDRDTGEVWFDVGSWSEFFVLKNNGTL